VGERNRVRQQILSLIKEKLTLAAKAGRISIPLNGTAEADALPNAQLLAGVPKACYWPAAP